MADTNNTETYHPSKLPNGSQVLYSGRVATVTQVRFQCPIRRCSVHRQSLSFAGDAGTTETTLALDPAYQGAA